MNIAVFHGSPGKGNTYKATKIFMEELSKQRGVQFTEFFFPKSLPEFCTGCQLCLGNPHEACPHSMYVTPILDAIIKSDALIFATPHYGASSMSAGMKNLLDHLDFLTLNVFPQSELFEKKAFIITTAAGSTAAIKPIKKYLINWGINRVYSYGIRMFVNKWDKMPEAKQARCEKKLKSAANHFYKAKKKSPYISAILMYHMSKFILKRYAGPDTNPYKYWQEKGYFKKRPF